MCLCTLLAVARLGQVAKDRLAGLGLGGSVLVMVLCLIGTAAIVDASLRVASASALDRIAIYGGPALVLVLVALALRPLIRPDLEPPLRLWRIPSWRRGRSERAESRTPVTIGDLKTVATRFLGTNQTCQALETHAFVRSLRFDPMRELDEQDLRFAEILLASAIGMTASRLAVSLLFKRQTMTREEVLQLVEDVSTAFHDRNDLLNEMMAATRHGIALFDRHLHLVAWQAGRNKLYNFTEGELFVGAKLEDLVRHTAARGFYGPGPIEALVAARMTAVLDPAIVKRSHMPDGKIVDLRTIRMPDGAYCMIYMDVTEQAESEKQREAENETLERRVRERTEALEELVDALAKAKAEAEEANISKTRFLAAASHDLLQPLNAARLYATALKERVQGRGGADDTLMLSVNVEDSLEALEDILTALLDMSLLDAGAMKTDIAVFRIHDVLRQLRVEFEPIAAAKGLALTFVPSSLAIVSDRRLLGRLLQNLVSNAIKYTLEGRVIVGVRHHQAQARIEVWDTGVGIPKSKQSEIFREFERLPAAIGMAPGLGLGLSIVQRLGRVLRHDVRIRSKPGRGSVFSILVPRAPDPQIARRHASESVPAGQRSLEGLSIVAIDNEPTILAGMEALLAGWGCQIVTGPDAASVGATLRTRGIVPDVIIADYHLDHGDGITAIAVLRARYGPCQAVLVTADQSPHVRDLALRANVRLLNKPLKPATLRALLSQWRLLKTP